MTTPMGKPRPPIPKALQLSIFRESKWLCHWCDRPVIFAPVMRLLEREIRKAGRTEPLAYFNAHGTRAGAPLLDELWGVVDHIEAHATGGTSDKDNLTTACNRCNMLKSSASLRKWGGREVRQPVRSKYGRPEHWDGLSAVFVVFAEGDKDKLSPSDREWLKVLTGGQAPKSP